MDRFCVVSALTVCPYATSCWQCFFVFSMSRFYFLSWRYWPYLKALTIQFHFYAHLLFSCYYDSCVRPYFLHLLTPYAYWWLTFDLSLIQRHKRILQRDHLSIYLFLVAGGWWLVLIFTFVTQHKLFIEIKNLMIQQNLTMIFFSSKKRWQRNDDPRWPFDIVAHDFKAN